MFLHPLYCGNTRINQVVFVCVLPLNSIGPFATRSSALYIMYMHVIISHLAGGYSSKLCCLHNNAVDANACAAPAHTLMIGRPCESSSPTEYGWVIAENAPVMETVCEYGRDNHSISNSQPTHSQQSRGTTLIVTCAIGCTERGKIVVLLCDRRGNGSGKE